MNTTENHSNLSTSSSMIHYLQLTYIPCLLLFGICGNIICIIVFNRKSLRRLRSSSFLFFLAIADIFFLLDLLPGWINTVFVRSFYHGANLVCKIQTYVSFVASFVHIWMVLAFTAERFFAVNFPLKHMSHCTLNFSRTIILMITIPAALFYIYPSFFASEIDNSGQCREKESHVRFLNHINMIDTILTMFLPFILVSMLNILIIRKLFCLNTFRKHVFENGSTYQYRRTSNWKKNQPTLEKSSPSIRKNYLRNESARRHVLTEIRLTKMLLAISLTCLSLNFPSYYSRLIIFYDQTKDEPTMQDDYSIFALYRDILLHYMSYLSYAINILIYFLFGAHFRRVFKRVFLRTKHHKSNRWQGKSFQMDNDTWSMDCSVIETTASLNGSIRVYSKSREHPVVRREILTK